MEPNSPTPYAGIGLNTTLSPVPDNDDAYSSMHVVHTTQVPPSPAISHTSGIAHARVRQHVLEYLLKNSPNQIADILAWFLDSGINTFAEFAEYFDPSVIATWYNPITSRPLSKLVILRLTNLYHWYATQLTSMPDENWLNVSASKWCEFTRSRRSIVVPSLSSSIAFSPLSPLVMTASRPPKGMK